MGLKIRAIHIFVESIQSWSQNKSSNKSARTSAQMDHATAGKIIESFKKPTVLNQITLVRSNNFKPKVLSQPTSVQAQWVGIGYITPVITAANMM